MEDWFYKLLKRLSIDAAQSARTSMLNDLSSRVDLDKLEEIVKIMRERRKADGYVKYVTLAEFFHEVVEANR